MASRLILLILIFLSTTGKTQAAGFGQEVSYFWTWVFLLACVLVIFLQLHLAYKERQRSLKGLEGGSKPKESDCPEVNPG